MKKIRFDIKDKPLMSIKKTKTLMITPKKVALIVFIIFLVLVLGYIYREICFLIRPPKLEIIQPPTDISISQNIIEIIGKTELTASLTINGYDVYINKDGSFKQKLI